MEVIKIIVMTISSKFNGRCVAGIEVPSGNWVRLTTDDAETHGAVLIKDLRCEDGIEFSVLDEIAVPIKGRCPNSIQPENVLLDTSYYIKINKKATIQEVLKIHPAEVRSYILGNKYAYITEERVLDVGYSLTLVEVENLIILQEENPSGKPKTKANFSYTGNNYENMSVTDPKFYSVANNSKFNNAYIVVSIGTPYNNKHYKFVSAIYL